MTSKTDLRAQGAPSRNWMRMALSVAGAGLVIASLSGCLGPTYGTGKSQGETLFDDLNNVVSLGDSSAEANARVAASAPRPDLVKPDNTSILPPPQPTRAAANLPESPEQRSARLQAAAYQGDGPIPAEIASARKENVPQGYLDRTTNGGGGLDTLRRENASTILSPQQMKGRGELMRQRLRDQRQGSADTRKYLSEPPVSYRKPAASAPVGEPGVDEEIKQRRMRNDNQTLASKIRNILPF